MTHLQKLKSIRLCLSAHPDNEVGSEFEDRIADLDEMIRTMESSDTALRDDFAKAAMQGELAAQADEFSLWMDDGESFGVLARRSYNIATAMMNERSSRLNK